MATRKIKYNNEDYYFNFDNFNKLLNDIKRKSKSTFTTMENSIAEELNVTPDAIHNWRLKKNGPSDIDIIDNLAKYLKINDVTILLKKGDAKIMNEFNNLQLDSIKRIYDSLIDFLDYFEKTDGYNNLWFKLKGDSCSRENQLLDIGDKEVDKVIKVYLKEYMFLNNTSIYDELGEVIYNDLADAYDGKVSYAYRFEAIVDGNPSTHDDYYKVLNKVNSIIDKYIKFK